MTKTKSKGKRGSKSRVASCLVLSKQIRQSLKVRANHASRYVLRVALGALLGGLGIFLVHQSLNLMSRTITISSLGKPLSKLASQLILRPFETP
jgi:hypothetical protein